MLSEFLDNELHTSVRARLVVLAIGFSLGFGAAIFGYTMFSEGPRAAQDLQLESGDYIVLYEEGGEVPSSWILVEGLRGIRQGDGMKFDVHIDGQVYPFLEGSEQVSK